MITSRIPISLAGLALMAPLAARAQEKITYQDHVRPVFENRCLNCHNPDKKKGDLDLSTFGGTMQGGSGGAVIEPGDSSASKLWQCVAHTAEPLMPPKSDKLPEAEIAIIAKWIQGGVLETASSSARAKKKVEFGMGLTAVPNAKPEGPPPMPENLLLEPVVAPARADAVKAMAHSPWAPLVAIAAPRQVLLYHSGTGELAGVLPFPGGGSPECLSFSRNGSLVLAGGGIAGKKGMVAVWEVKTGKLVIELEEGADFDTILAADMSADQTRIATGGPGRKVRIYDTKTQQCIATIKKHTDWVTALAFSPDGVLLATGDRNGGLYVWEAATGNEFYTLKAHEKMIAAVAWRADSNVVGAGSEDGQFTWWEMQNGNQIKKVGSHGGVLALNFASDGRMASGGRDGHVRIWDGNGNQKRDWVPDDGNLVLSVAFTEDGKNLLTGAWNGSVKRWDAEKDGPALALSANPPTIEERLAQLATELAAKQGEVDKALAALSEKQQMVEQAKADIESTKAEIAAAAAEAQRLTGEMEGIRAASAKLTESRTTLEADLATVKERLGAALPAGAEAAAGMTPEVQAALTKADAAGHSLDKLTHSVLDGRLKTLQQHLAGLEAEEKARRDTLASVEAVVAQVKAKAADLEKAMPDKEKLMAEAGKALADMQPTADAARASLEPIHRSRQRWEAARENKFVLTLSAETAELTDKVEDLKAEAAELETKITSLTAQLAAQPAPEAKDAAKLDSELAASRKRVEEIRQEQQASAAAAAEKAKALEEARRRFAELSGGQGA